MAEQRACAATRKDGTPCRAPALPGDSLCWAHSPATAAKREQARRNGGRERMRRDAVIPSSPDVAFQTPADVLALLGRVAGSAMRGELSPRVANCAVYAASVALRCIEGSELERRISELELMVRQLGGGSRA
jgi:hypothetical protein